MLDKQPMDVNYIQLIKIFKKKCYLLYQVIYSSKCDILMQEKALQNPTIIEVT